MEGGTGSVLDDSIHDCAACKANHQLVIEAL